MVPVKIGRRSYPSVAEAARALGVTYQRVYRALEEGRLDDLEKRRAQPHSRQVEYNGKTYPSLSAAARALGVHKSTLGKRVQEGRDIGSGLPHRRDPRHVPLTIRGKTFPTISDAARELRVPRTTLRRWLAKLDGKSVG